MVSTRGEMEARLEILERGFKGLLATGEKVEKILEDDRKERVETSQQVAELTALMRRKLRTTPGSPNDSDDETSVHTNHPQKREERWRKLEIPVFEGTDAYGWLNRVERYFDLKKMSDGEKLQAVMVAMEGKALAWYQWWEFSTQNPTWEDFRTAILRRFQPAMIQSPFELLLSLKQTGTVEEYQEQFELYAGPLKCTEPSYLKGMFLNGLKDVIRAELKLHPVERLTELMDYAQRVDEKNNLLNKGNGETNSGGEPTFKNHDDSRVVTSDPGNKSNPQTVSSAASSSCEANQPQPNFFKDQGFRRLTDAELKNKSLKGLCFRCNEKFSPGHVCANKQFQVLLLEENVEGENYGEKPKEVGCEFKFWDPGRHLGTPSP